MKNDSNVILDKLYKTLKYCDLLNRSLNEIATMVEDQLDNDGNEIIDDLSRARDGFIEFYRGIGLAIARMNAL